MKKTKIFFVLVIIVFTMTNRLIAQSPDMFNYQAVARDVSKNPLVNTGLNIDITIRQAAPDGSDVYNESHIVSTNEYGLFSIIIGNGTSSQNLDDIDWSSGPYYLKVDIDGSELSNTRLISVPYASFANTAANVINSTDFVRYNDTIYYIEGNVGIGTADPRSTLSVTGTTPNDSAIFEVKNNAGLTLFGVYNDGVRIVIDETAGTKGPKGGFAIGGFDGTKAPVQDYLTVNADSTRIYVNQSGKGPKGGFAIGGFDNTKKGVLDNFVFLTPENYLIGHESGKNITSGLYNSFIGYQSGMADTSGSYNVFLGYQAGMNNTGGDFQGGSNNVFLGNKSGYYNTTGQDNVFLGYNAGYKNIRGNTNVFLGYAAGSENESGDDNVYIGFNAGFSDSTGTKNVYIGYEAGGNANKGVLDNLWNVAIGTYAGESLRGTIANTFVGHDAGRYTTSGASNTFLGQASGKMNDTGNGNTFLGSDAGREGANTVSNTFVGVSAGMNIEGNWNTFVGHRSGITLTGGYGNTFLGKNTGESRTAGMYNVLIGVNAGKTASSTNYNVIVGSNAAQAALGTGNTFIGHAAGYDATGDNNVFVGYNAGYYETGSDRLYIANSDASSANALIYGEFNNSILQINGQLGIGGAYSPDRQLQVHGDIAVTGGSFIDDGTVISDYVFNGDYRLMSIGEHADFMWKNSHLPALKSAREIEAAGGYDMSLRREQILEELEIAHIFIEQLNKRIETLEKENIELKKTQELILKKITELENN